MVDYLGEPKTTREQIRVKTETYHNQWPTVLEEIVTPINVVKEGNRHVVSYTTEWRTERNGEWRSGKNDLTLSVRTSIDGLRITRQAAQRRDGKTGKDSSGNEPSTPASTPVPAPVVASKIRTPPIRIALSGSIWACTQSNDTRDGRTEVLDAVSLGNNRFVYQKTYRSIDRAGKVVEQQTGLYEGNTTREGEVLALYAGSLAWKREDEIGRWNSARARMLQSKVGQFIRVRIQGDDLVGIDFPAQLKRQ